MMNVRGITIIYGLILASLLFFIGCNNNSKPKTEKEILEETLLGSWSIEVDADKLDNNDSLVIYNFKKAHLLVVTRITNSPSNKEAYFIPISYNYQSYLNNTKQTNEEIEVGSWRILNNQSLIFSHLNPETEHLSIKSAKVIINNKDSITLQETAYVEKTDEQGLNKIAPETYYINLKRIFNL